MKKKEHLQWAKDRALREPNGVMMWASFSNDMSKHDELKNHIALPLIITIKIMDKYQVIEFIKGFN